MGMILLAGTIVNNSILLLDFILNAREKGFSREEAIIQSVRIRTRPILMTASSTVIGLTPLVFEMAVGLERLSPLGIVAAAGLILGTFLTMIVIPVIYLVIDDFKNKLSFKPGERGTAVVILVFLSVSFIFPRVSFADGKKQRCNSDGKKVFSLKSAIKYALDHSPDIKESAADIEKTKGATVKVRANLLPQISLNSVYTNYQEEHAIVPGIAGTEERFDNNTISNKAEASWLITDFGKSFYAFKSAKNFYLASTKSLERKKEVVIYTTAKIYFNIVSLDKLIISYKVLRKSMAELQRRIRQFIKEGKSARIDLLKVNVRLAEIDDNIARLESQKEYLLGLLSQEMGYKGGIETQEDLKLFNIKADELSRTEEFNKALQHREDLAGYKYLVKSSYFGLKSSKRAYFPEVKAFGGAGEFAGFSGEARFSGNDRWEDDYWAGIKVTLPIFDSGLREGGILKAKGDYDFNKAHKYKILLGVYKDVSKSLADIESSRKRINFAETSKEEAEEALRLEKLKYKEGKGVINDVLDAEAAVRKADYLYYSAVSDYNTSVFELYLSEGLLVESYGQIIFGRGKLC